MSQNVTGQLAGSLAHRVHSIGLHNRTAKLAVNSQTEDLVDYLKAYPSISNQDACGVAVLATLDRKPTHNILSKALIMLSRMDHRGATGEDPKTSDGVGIMTEIPHDLLKTEFVDLPKPGSYGVGSLFLPKSRGENIIHWKESLSLICFKEGFRVVGWRYLATNEDVLGEIAESTSPQFVQFIVEADNEEVLECLEHSLYILRKSIESSFISFREKPYVVSLSSRNIIYKGLMLSENLQKFYLDLQNPAYKTRYAIVHQRFSTNTEPKWRLAQPFRKIAHNGEINTLRGNINALVSRERSLKRKEPDHPLAKLATSIDKNSSDSGIFDSAIERDLLFTNDIEETLLGFSPDPYETESTDADEIAFYQYKSLSREPWDGPAFIGFSHQSVVGAKLDRNGLRPARYTITSDGEFLVSSENGVVDIDPEAVIEKGRLGPGEAISVDIETGIISKNSDIRARVTRKNSYRHLLDNQIIELKDLSRSRRMHQPDSQRLQRVSLPRAYYYSTEDIEKIILPMAETGKEPTASMGNDTNLAVLSTKPRLLYDYFKQIFAQVTNPALDAIREKTKTSTSCYLGASLLETSTLAKRPCIRLDSPILLDEEYQRITRCEETRQRIGFIDAVFCDAMGLKNSLSGLHQQVEDLVEQQKDIIVIDDGKISKDTTPIPMLLAVASIHHHLIRIGKRPDTSILARTLEARDVHQCATLIGYGANAVYPELAYNLARTHSTKADFNPKKLSLNLKKALTDGLVKIMSKIGISTVRSYHGAQTFEAVGISKQTIDEHFTWTQSKIGGITLNVIEQEACMRKSYLDSNESLLPSHGMLAWRKNGENRIHTPKAVLELQKAVTLSNKKAFENFCDEIDNNPDGPTLRSCLEISFPSDPLDLDEVEPIESIVKRFTTGAMSLGSISSEAHETISVAMNRLGAKSNSGEGGEKISRSQPLENGDSKKSAIRQIASGRFGVNTRYLVDAEELQIKVAQGAKPGEGGQLPGHKVTLEIGKVRGSTPGVTLISPPPHHDIYSIEDLAQLIYDLKTVNPRAKVSVKLVAGTGVGTIASGVAKAKADVILISGGDGGTGASPVNSILHAGLPWEIGLSETHESLSRNGLRDRVTLQTDGGLRTPKDLVIASILGAEQWGLGSVGLMAIGCIMMRQCHLNTCPVGIATQNPELKKFFKGKPDHLTNYIIALATEVRNMLAKLAVRSIDELIGRTDLLSVKAGNGKRKFLELEHLLTAAKHPLKLPKSFQDHRLGERFDQKVIIPVLRDQAKNQSKKDINITSEVTNLDRSIGTMAAGFVEHDKLNNPDSHFHSKRKIVLNLRGTAGQSFMAFGSESFHVNLHGEANDYVGKGLSGAVVAISPLNEKIQNQVLIGNTALYGASSGTLFVAGQAGERFAVRNSGATAVIEGVGQHALEYMTGGTVLIIGEVGSNIGAGMSGGLAYIFDPLGELHQKLNPAMQDSLKRPEPYELEHIITLIQQHYELTASKQADMIIRNWANLSSSFAALKPTEYLGALQKLGRKHEVNIPIIPSLAEHAISSNL